MSKEHPNALLHETSPYLLQHAYNPVAWQAWKPEVLERARLENKLLLVSIGYAACHWCHVMEKECFEDKEVAEVMNRHFIPIKVDREERPDIDHIYMDALQLMTGSGGWPLNVVALPDGRPFWGATYVKKEDWIQVLVQLATLYRAEPDKVLGYASNLADGLQAINLVSKREEQALLGTEKLTEIIAEWSSYFDTFLGGYKRAPKFMMPVVLNFLLHYAHVGKDEKLMDYVNTTLTKMAHGGIFDPVSGGFSRYSVDVKWHVPHFEKMLYDNAQLTSLYSKAYAATGNPLYKEVAQKCILFVRNELMAPGHAFYSSLDADSLNPEGELEEGAYYVWRKEELEQILGNRFDIFGDYYNINDYGYWEEGKFVLIRDATDEEVADKHGLKPAALRDLINQCLAILGKERGKRKPPRLDDKILTSWNGLMLQGLVDAARYLEEEEYLELAGKLATFIKEELMEEDGRLYHNLAEPKSRIPGYLEDYASVIEAFLGMYEQTFSESWLMCAKKLADYCLEYYHDETSKMFFFTSREEPFVVRRTLETTDNVIPASNSMMAKNLFVLSRYFPEQPYGNLSLQMLVNMKEQMEGQAQSHANWLQLLLYQLWHYQELAILGPEAHKLASNIRQHYLPGVTLAGSDRGSDLPLLKDRFHPGKTLFYVCSNGSCKLPEEDWRQVLGQLIPR